MFGQDRRVIAGALADELLEGPHLTRRLRPRAEQSQRHRLAVLARDVGDEQATQIHLRPRPLLPPGKQRGEARVIRGQLLTHIREVRGC